MLHETLIATADVSVISAIRTKMMAVHTHTCFTHKPNKSQQKQKVPTKTATTSHTHRAANENPQKNTYTQISNNTHTHTHTHTTHNMNKNQTKQKMLATNATAPHMQLPPHAQSNFEMSATIELLNKLVLRRDHGTN